MARVELGSGARPARVTRARLARVTAGVAIALAAFTVAVMLWRMMRGVDVTDEAFYVAMPLRFALGDRPFIDELNITQTASLLLYPFVKAWTSITGSATGIFLFVRLLYLLFFGGVGWSAYALARTRLPFATSLLLGASCLCFVPYGIPGLSYNTLSMGLFAVGLLVIARHVLAPARTRRAWFVSPLLWAGFGHGAAAFSYPTVALGAMATAAAIAILASGERVRATLHYVAGGLAFVLLVSPWLVSAGAAQLGEVVAYSSGEQAATGLVVRLRSVLGSFEALHPQLAFAAFVVALGMLLARRWPSLAAVALAFTPLLARGSAVAGSSASVAYVSCFAMLGPLLGLALRDRRTAHVLRVGVAMPSMVAGLATAWSSSNNALAAGVGLYPAALLTAITLAMVIEETAQRLAWRWVRAALAFSPAVFVGIMLRYATAEDACYREGPLSALTARIAEGPYRGLYTTPQRSAALAAIREALRGEVRSERTLFYFDFPAGYLITFTRPIVTSPWTFALPGHLERDARFFRERARPGDLVVRDDARWVSTANVPPGAPLGANLGDTPLDHEVAARCDLVTRGEGYSFYRVR